MFHQIVLILILAFATLPRLQPGPARPEAKQTIEQQRKRTPTPRPVLSARPKMIDVRLIDPPLGEMARWLSENFDLPYTSEPPRLERVPSADLYRLRYRVLLPPRSSIGREHSTSLLEHRREVVAVYDDSSRTIHLPESWTGATVAEQSVIVHEMVHHLQNLAGVKYLCAGARERPAYMAQSLWLKQHGLELEKEFEVDMFTVVALSACTN